MTDRRRMTLDDNALGSALRALASDIDWPEAASGGGPDLATRVRARLPLTPPRSVPWWRPARRALVLALAALLVLVAIAAAVGLGLPGLRITFGQPSVAPSTAPATTAPSTPASPTATPSDPGWSLGLGKLSSLADAGAAFGRPIVVPTDPMVGPPDAVYIDASRGDQVAEVWRSGGQLPPSLEPSVGLLLMSFDGTTDGYYEKMLGSGTVIVPVKVGGRPGYWITGAPHFFFYTRPGGTQIDDERRWVGDALIWSDGVTTYRLEGSLDRATMIRIAESVR